MIVDVKFKENTISNFLFSKSILATHTQELKSHSLHELFAQDPARSKKMQVPCEGLTLDFSRQRITQETLNIFTRLASENELQEKISALMRGDLVNVSEDRPALHTALRDFSPTPIYVDGQNIKPVILANLEKMRLLCEGFWNKGIEDVIVIGIGGSYWGSRSV